MAEYQHFDGETYITFNIVFATDNEIQIVATNRGKISVLTYDLYLAITRRDTVFLLIGNVELSHSFERFIV